MCHSAATGWRECLSRSSPKLRTSAGRPRLSEPVTTAVRHGVLYLDRGRVGQARRSATASPAMSGPFMCSVREWSFRRRPFERRYPSASSVPYCFQPKDAPLLCVFCSRLGSEGAPTLCAGVDRPSYAGEDRCITPLCRRPALRPMPPVWTPPPCATAVGMIPQALQRRRASPTSLAGSRINVLVGIRRCIMARERLGARAFGRLASADRQD